MEWGEILGLLAHNVTVPEAVRRWGGNPGSVALVSEGVNVVFRFEAGEVPCYLRFTHDSLISERRVASAVDFLRHLSSGGAPVCEPVASQSGKFVEVMEHDGSNWIATATREVAGASLGLDRTDLDIYEAWGRSLGETHRVAETYVPGPECEFQHWRDIWERTRDEIHPQDALAQKERQLLNDWYHTLSEQPPEFGLTHTDYNPRNNIWDGQRVTAIDFDEPSWGWFALDVARALVEFLCRPRGQRIEFRESFLRGYRCCRELSDSGEAQIKGFTRMWALIMYAPNAAVGAAENSAEQEIAASANDFCQFMRNRFEDQSLWD